MQSIKNIIMNKIAVSVGKWEEKKSKIVKKWKEQKICEGMHHLWNMVAFARKH